MPGTTDTKIKAVLFDLDGTLYFPKAHVNIGGTSDSFSITQLIADSSTLSCGFC